MKLKYMSPMTYWALLGPEYALMDAVSASDPEDLVDGGEQEW